MFETIFLEQTSFIKYNPKRMFVSEKCSIDSFYQSSHQIKQNKHVILISINNMIEIKYHITYYFNIIHKRINKDKM